MRVEHFSGLACGACAAFEIFDAETPHKPRGCVAQAWSVAEVLRCWLKTAPAAPDSSD
ncbi:MAG: amylo-alpha-1,6-glucosidase [Acidobacteriota bacterium]